MKKMFVFLVLFTGISFSALAQQNRDEKVQALKIAFLTERLQLTKTEAQKFWPIYNKYDAEVTKLSKESKDGSVLENEEKLLKIRKKYNSSFEDVLGKEKTNKLFVAEKEFRNVLIKRLKSGNQGRHRR